MRLWQRRFQFSLRALLAAMVVIAVLLTSWKRAEGLRHKATEHANKAQEYADIAWGIQRFGGFSPDAESQAQKYWRLHAYHRDLSKHYGQAAWRPWVRVREQPAPEEEGNEEVGT